MPLRGAYAPLGGVSPWREIDDTPHAQGFLRRVWGVRLTRCRLNPVILPALPVAYHAYQFPGGSPIEPRLGKHVIQPPYEVQRGRDPVEFNRVGPACPRMEQQKFLPVVTPFEGHRTLRREPSFILISVEYHTSCPLLIITVKSSSKRRRLAAVCRSPPAQQECRP